MQIVALDAKTLKVEELDLSSWRALGTLSLYDRTDPALVSQRLRGADVVLTNKRFGRASCRERVCLYV